MSTDHKKHILLVDDDERVLFVVSESLEKLGGQVDIVTAVNGEDALEKIKSRFYDLVITDLKMPKMNGFDLTKRIQTISPETQIIWMTAFGNQNIQAKAQSLGIRHFLTKPLAIADIRKIAEEALKVTIEHQSKDPIHRLDGHAGLKKRIEQLKSDANAYAVLVITVVGNVLASTGTTPDLDIDALSALIAGNFLASNQVAKMLEQESSFRLSYHESDRHNIYAYGIDENYLLVTVSGRESRPGAVWFYAQRAAIDISNILSAEQYLLDDEGTDTLFPGKVDEELDTILNDLWGDAPDTSEESLSLAKEPQTDTTSGASVKTFSYDEAVKQGIVSKHLA